MFVDRPIENITPDLAANPPKINAIRNLTNEKNKLFQDVIVDTQISEISERIRRVSSNGRWVLYEVRMLPEVIDAFEKAGYTIGDYNDVSKTYTIRWDD